MNGANTTPPSQPIHPATGIVVEDMPATREWLAQALRQAFPGIGIHTAATVEQARTWLKGHASRHHQASVLALIDLRLPDGSGLDIVRLCDRQGIVPVVTSIYDDDASLFEALEAGAQGYLLKDHPLPQLVHYLHRIGQGEPPLSPSIARRILASLRGQPEEGARAVGDSQGLTPREAEVLRHIGQGLRVSDVAHALSLTEHTVAGYVKNIYRKLNISSRAQAALEAARRQLL
ncbi:response regulator transcription factor [Pusillimonas noertemannii]|uniref:response regulator transcription factor n=1 Tax=Pusillimonas noertemannii TaxID=305977 RepID=UPI00333ECB1A